MAEHDQQGSARTTDAPTLQSQTGPEGQTVPGGQTGKPGSGKRRGRGKGRRSGRGSTKGKRRIAREMAVQMLYQRDMGDSTLHQVFETFRPEDYVRALHPDDTEEGEQAASQELARDRKLFEQAFHEGRDLVQGTITHLPEIDQVIQGQADNWRLERMPAVDRNVLRLAVFELMFEPETPQLVVVDEAIELAKRFGTEQSARFINGLLDGLLKSRRHLQASSTQTSGAPKTSSGTGA